MKTIEDRCVAMIHELSDASGLHEYAYAIGLINELLQSGDLKDEWTKLTRNDGNLDSRVRFCSLLENLALHIYNTFGWVDYNLATNAESSSNQWPPELRHKFGSAIALNSWLSTIRYMLVELRCHCLLYTSPSPRDQRGSRMPSSA